MPLLPLPGSCRGGRVMVLVALRQLLLLLSCHFVGTADSKQPMVQRAAALLQVRFPSGAAGLPSVSLGGQLWAEAAPIIIGEGCVAEAAGATVNGSSNDQWGRYSFVQTPYRGCAVDLVARVQLYEELPAAAFLISLPNGAQDMAIANGTKSPALAPIASFPSIPFAAPMNASRTFSWAAGQLGFRSATGVSATTFNGQTGNVPSPVFFVGPRNRTLVVGPLDHFHTWACTTTKPAPGVVAGVAGWGCGIMNTVPTLPRGFQSATVMFGGVGVTDTMAAWGSAMRRYYNTTRRVDLQTTKLGVYTDNGAFYNNRQNFNGSTAPEVFGQMFDLFKAESVPVHYLMLDDWWYTGVHPGSMLIDTPVANPALFPHGLRELWERVGVPLDIYSVRESTLMRMPLQHRWPSPGV
eukprot:COSAG01_NODE_11366_length_1951_cov_2.083153_1_plen_409_part_00